MAEPLLTISDLHVSFFTDKGEVRAVRGIDLEVQPGQTLALVGESGCGKSATALAIMRLIESPGRIVAGSLAYNGRDLARLSEAELRSIRGKSIGMIFQEPMTSLNPVFTIGNQIGEVLQLHQGLSVRAASQGSRAVTGNGWDSLSGATARTLSARAVRGDETTSDDRHGAGLPAGFVNCRRTNHSPGCHGPGSDSRFAQTTPG